MIVQVPAHSPYATTLAYSRLVSVGEDAWISGCAPMDAEGAIIGLDNPCLQAIACIARIRSALEAVGFVLADVVRLRIYLRSFAHIEEVARAQFEAFESIRPACTVIAAADFVAPQVLVYMDADARRTRPQP